MTELREQTAPAPLFCCLVCGKPVDFASCIPDASGHCTHRECIEVLLWIVLKFQIVRLPSL